MVKLRDVLEDYLKSHGNAVVQKILRAMPGAYGEEIELVDVAGRRIVYKEMCSARGTPIAEEVSIYDTTRMHPHLPTAPQLFSCNFFGGNRKEPLAFEKALKTYC